jgi:2-polyprenyl-3-methyl-5-hydroxy-6-metoxy-1,4-benzoquinol methylase
MEQNEAFNRSDVSQESQYTLPYHYIPSIEDGHFQQHLYWTWGYHYLGAIELVLSILAEEPFESLIDVGCGDGRFLLEVSKRYFGKMLLGVDSSQRAIQLARALNPNLNFECVDICANEQRRDCFTVLTLIEVLEHIPVNSVNNFVLAIAGYQKPGGRLVLTVPHKNKAVQAKHYQHFNRETLTKIIEPYYHIERMLFFDKRSRVFHRIMNGLLGNRFFVLNNRFLLKLLYRTYRKHFFFCSEAKCGRICLVGRKA